MSVPGDRELRRFAHNLAWLRMCAVIGQALTITVVVGALHLAVPWLPLCASVAFLTAFGLLTVWRLSRPWPVTGAELVCCLAIDLAELAFVLYLTGGSANPFITLLIIPIALAATALPVRDVAVVTGLAGAAYLLLIVRHLPLPGLHPHDDADAEFRVHLLGMAITFATCAALLSFFITRLARDARVQAVAVQRERERALRDEGILAIAIQAASAAHEMNTPLSTLVTLIGELRRENAFNGALCGDLDLLAGQVTRCRDILRGLVEVGTSQLDQIVQERSLAEFLAACVDRFRLLRPAVNLQLSEQPGSESVRLRASPDLHHAVLNLLNNACEASQLNGSTQVLLSASSEGANAVFSVRDFGPGLASDTRTLGLRFVSSKRDGLGLGLALASATVERYGGSLTAEPATGGGTCTRLSIPVAAPLRNPLHD
jgi:two-component system sensor histidine kinase RegB